MKRLLITLFILFSSASAYANPFLNLEKIQSIFEDAEWYAEFDAMYVRPEIGGNLVNGENGNSFLSQFSPGTSTDNDTFGFATGGGLQFNEHIRVGLEYSFFDMAGVLDLGGAAIDEAIDYYNFGVKAIYAREIYEGFGAYIGGTLGLSIISMDAKSYPANPDTNTVFMYQFMAGANYTFDIGIRLHMGYRYMGFNDPTFKLGAAFLKLTDMEAHALEFGASYEF